jgi:putative membrane protein
MMARNTSPFARRFQDGWTGGLAAVSAFALLASWFLPGTAALWEALDAAVYYALNATVSWGTPFAEFWALTGDRRFDIVAAVIVIAIFISVFMTGGLLSFRRGLYLGFCLTATLLITIGLQRQLIAIPRLSPSLVLEPHHTISSLVSWSRAKEASRTSFPGDHATVMLIVSWFFWRWGGAKLGLWALLLTVAFTLPRFAAGAHWLTDLTIGAGVSTLVAVAVLWGTPLGYYIAVGAWRIASDISRLWIWALRQLGHERAPLVHPQKQMLRGICIGMADLVPGVSGGTMALILGVYQRLIAAVARVDSAWFGLVLRGRLIEALRRIDILFIAPIAAGMLFAIILFSRIVPIGLLIAELPEMMFGLFFGLIAASVVSLFRRVEAGPWTGYGWLGIGIALGFSTVLIVPVSTPDDVWMLFLSGMAAATAMLMPGISGAYVLLLLGKYSATIEALGQFDWRFMAPLAFGAIVGALGFSRLIAWLLEHYYRRVMLTVTGLLGGTLLAIWPFQEWVYVEVGGKSRLVSATPYMPQTLDIGVLLGLVMIGVGIVVYRSIERLAHRQPLLAGGHTGRNEP